VTAGASAAQRGTGARSQVVAGLVVAAVGGFALIAGWSLDFGTLRRPGPGFFPLSLSVLLAAAGVAIALRAAAGVLAGRGEPWPDRAGARRVVTMVAALLAMTLLFESLGFVACAAGVTFVMLRYVGGRGWIASALFGVVLAACLYLLFARWLGVDLPAGVLAHL
jgi:hypothetical protein